jgi:VanZ family protein
MQNRPVTIIVSVAFLAFIVYAALGPAKSVPRTGLGWQIDHFAGYFVLTSMLSLVWRRALMIGAAVASLALALEMSQSFTSDRFPDFMGAFYSVFGVTSATLLADVFFRARTVLRLGIEDG